MRKKQESEDALNLRELVKKATGNPSEMTIHNLTDPVRQKQEQAARLAVEVLRPDGEPKGSKRPTVRELRAFREGAPLYRELISTAGADHPAAALLHEALMLLACGYHEFDSCNKAAFYARSREHISRAAMALLLDDEEARRDLIDRLEMSLLPAIGGLIHRAERRERRR